MNLIQEKIRVILNAHVITGRYIVAFSGGVDSMVLLHALAQVVKSNAILAVHINHDLQPEAQQWADFCVEQASQLQVACHIEKVFIDCSTGNIEEKARNARYQVFSNTLTKDDLLLTAHHQDDQAETLLLQLMRGSGIDGLAAMRESKSYSDSILLRPLLSFSKDDLLEYAKINNLCWVEDPSNSEEKYDRNFIRHKIIPLLQNRWPSANKLISRSALNCQESNDIVSDQISFDFSHCVGQYNHSLSIDKLSKLSVSRMHSLIRYWVKQLGFKSPDRNKIEFICSDFIYLRHDAQPLLRWSDVELHRFDGYLYLLKQFSTEDRPSIKLTKDDLQKGSVDFFTSSGNREPSGNISFSIQIKNETEKENIISIDYRQTGDGFLLKGREGTRKLKKLFQQWKVPPWMRQFVPIINYNGECVAIADYAICEMDDNVIIDQVLWQPNINYDWRANL